MRSNTVTHLILGTILSSAVFAQPVTHLRLVPFPRQVEQIGQSFKLSGLHVTPAISIVSDEKLQPIARDVLGPELELAGLKADSTVGRNASPSFDVLLSSPLNSNRSITHARLSEHPRPGEYALHVGNLAVEIRGADREGALNGLRTLAQLIRANRQKDELLGVEIHDWPTLRYRAFQDDLTRGPSSTLDELKREVRVGSMLKLNVFTYYMEYQYQFSQHPEIGPKDGSLLPSDLKSLVDYAGSLGVDVLGNQQSFGHFASILKHEKYASLRETGDILSPVNEATYQLLDEMYSEVIPLLPFGFFNVCCDETADLGKGPSKALADKIGVGAVYAGHLKRLHDLITGKYHKRMMMWGDIILNHPDKLELIPKDTVLLTWGYEPAASFDPQIAPFAKSGYEFFVCPGVNCWSRILPDFEKASANIQVFTRDGVKHGALGMLNTAWDDDGESLNAPNWYGFAWGAECAWSGGQTKIEDFNRRLGGVLFGESGDHFGQAIALLGKAEHLPGMNGMFNNRFWNLDLDQKEPAAAERWGQADALLQVVTPAITRLEALRAEAKTNADLVDSVLFGARRMQLIGVRIQHQQAAAKLYATVLAANSTAATAHAARETGDHLLAQAEKLVRELRDRHRELGDEWRKLWMSENRPYALDWSEKRYDAAIKTYDGILARLAEARASLKSGKPLPSLEALGLGWPQGVTSQPN